MSDVFQSIAGLGDGQFTIAVYIANRPNLPEYQSLNKLTALKDGEITYIGQTCGNGWRKVFNVYAKLLYALDPAYFHFANVDSAIVNSWQSYRDHYLLQKKSGTALMFSPPCCDHVNMTLASSNHKVLHIICGRTYAKQLIQQGFLSTQLIWLDEEFAIDLQQCVVVCPYFDYRQLSNNKIDRLASLLKGILVGKIIDVV
jgi:hypothetical protein